MTRRHRKGSLYRRGNVWWLKFMVDGALIRQSLDTTNKAEAERKRTEVMRPLLAAEKTEALSAIVARLDGAKRDQENVVPPLTLTDAWDVYSSTANRPDSGEETLKRYKAQCVRFAHWMRQHHKTVHAMRDVTPEIAGEYASHLGRAGVSPSTYNQHIGFLRLLWKTLRREARSQSNPWMDIKRRTLPSLGRRELTLDELRRVCESTEGEMRLLFALGLYCGFRLGDAATLRWAEVDLKRNRIARIPMKTARRNPKPVLVPIHPVLKALLEESPLDKRGEYVLPDSAAAYLQGKWDVSKRVQQHFEKNGIKTTKRIAGRKRALVEVGFHSLRHTFVSLCREANAPLAVVEAIVGHSNPAMTRHYTHVSELAAGQAVNALPAVVGVATGKALPPSRMIDSAPILEIAQGLTAKNWRATKEKLLAVLVP